MSTPIKRRAKGGRRHQSVVCNQQGCRVSNKVVLHRAPPPPHHVIVCYGGGGARACPNLASVMCVQDACDEPPPRTHISSASLDVFAIPCPQSGDSYRNISIAQRHAIKPPFSRVATSLARFVRSRTRDLSGGRGGAGSDRCIFIA